MRELYSTQGWAGDEDNGEMASWYILSALGLYSLENAKDELVLGSPAIRHANVQMPNNRQLIVATENQSLDNVYVQSVTWAPHDGPQRTMHGNVIKYTEVMGGGKLTFFMGASPSSPAASKPVSFLARSAVAVNPKTLESKTVHEHSVAAQKDASDAIGSLQEAQDAFKKTKANVKVTLNTGTKIERVAGEITDKYPNKNKQEQKKEEATDTAIGENKVDTKDVKNRAISAPVSVVLFLASAVGVMAY